MHLDREFGLSPRILARHLGLAQSTLSASIARLAKLGYLFTPNDKDRRRRELRLSDSGAEASTSVLNGKPVQKMLKRLKLEERNEALRGLQLLAWAARQIED